MADVSSDLKNWSTTASSNAPTDATTIGSGLADNFQELQKVVRQDLAHKGADIASAGTTDLGAVVGLMHDITGTTTITSFGTVSAGIWKIVKFEGALTLTHNATSLILPGGQNITTVAGDVGIFMSEGSGNWRCLSFLPTSNATDSPLTATRVPFAGTGGRLTDDSGFTFNTTSDILTVGAINVAGTTAPTSGWYLPSADLIRTPNSVTIDDNLTVTGGTITTGASTALSLATTAGTQLKVADSGDGSASWTIYGRTTGNIPVLATNGTDTNISMSLVAKGTGAVSFYTGGAFTGDVLNAALEQVRITNTASASRYITLTGSNGAASTIGTSAGPLYHSAKTQIGSSTEISTGYISELVNTGSGKAATIIKNDDQPTNAGLVWNASTSGDAQFLTFSTEASPTARGTIDYNRAGGQVRYNVTSDERLKIDRGVASKPLYLPHLTVHDFDWRENGQRSRGVFAQEAHKIFPDAISVGTDGDDLHKPWGASYSAYVPDLIVGWQEHDRRLAALEARLN